MKAFHGYPDGASPAHYEGRKPFSRAADQAAYNASDDPHAVRRQAHNDRLAYEAHPRNPDAVAQLEALMVPYVDMAKAHPDPQIRRSLMVQVRNLADSDEFLRRNADKTARGSPR